MNLKPEDKVVGQENYHAAVAAADSSGRLGPDAGLGRRDFLKGIIATGAISGAGLGATYFGYGKTVESPVRVGVIGTGDEGNVLIGALNPNYVQVVAISDIRPYSIYRAFHGDWSSPAAIAARTGLMTKYGWKSEDEARSHVKVYDKDYQDLLNDKNVEAVIIALPLHLHAKVVVEVLKKGKHVLTEKLMAHNIAQCKVMGRLSEQQGLLLATGHQRHYSVLYDNAVKLLKWGVLGEIQHIRAQWHRGNLPGNDSWAQPPGGEDGVVKGKKTRIDTIAKELKEFEEAAKKIKDPADAAFLEKKVAQWRAWVQDAKIRPEDYDYGLTELATCKVTPMEELVRWRLFDRTGGGLMAELGSHQLDAASIFCSALRAKDKGKAHPLTVHCIGGRHTFPLDRDADDHVYCMFEFPGPGYDPDFDVGYKDKVNNYPDPETGILPYEKDPNKRIVVTYSSIMGNGFGGYGEVVMCSKGTLILEREQEVLLYKGSDTSTKVGVKDDKGGPTLDTQQSGKAGPLAKAAADLGPVSRGYTEEIEHWAWCIRNPDPNNVPRCQPKVAMGDAIIALTSRVAMKNNLAGKGGFIAFNEEWYDLHHPSTPDGSSVEKEWEQLVGGSLPS